MIASRSIWVWSMILMAHLAGAQVIDNVHLRFKVDGLTAGDQCQLAYHMGAKQYVKEDSLTMDKDGIFHFKGDSMPTGMYLFVFPDKSYVEFILSEQSFVLSTSLKDAVGNMQVDGSIENKLFFEYLRFLAKSRLESQEVKVPEGEAATAEQQAQLNDIQKRVQAYQSSFLTKHADKVVGRFLKANIETPIPDAPDGMTAEEVQNFRYRHYKKHYFDNIDWSAGFLTYSPVLYNKIHTYLERLTYTIPDSHIVSSERILALVKKGGNEDVFRATLIQLVNRYATSKKVCFDKVYVHLVEEYYLTGKASWISKEQLNRMNDRVTVLRNVQCQRISPNFELPDVNGKLHKLWDIEGENIVVLFWNPDCEECRTATAQLKSLHNSRPEKLTVITVYTGELKAEWLAYIRENDLGNWINLYNGEEAYDFRSLYNVSSTPVLFLLDKQHVIQYKRINVKQVSDILK